MAEKTTYDPMTKTWSGPGALIESKIKNESVAKKIMDGFDSNLDSVIQISYDTGEVLTRQEMKLMSVRVAQNFENFGYKRGDVVMIIARNNPRLAPVLYGTILMGAIVNPLDVTFEHAEIRHMIATTEPKVIVVDEDLLEIVQKLATEVRSTADIIVFGSYKNSNYKSVEADLLKPTEKEHEFTVLESGNWIDTPVMILCSSGTTGLNKGVLLSHAHFSEQILPLPPNTVLYTNSSIFWLSGMMIYLLSSMYQLTNVVTAQPFSPKLTVNLIEKYKVHVTFQRPSFLAQLTDYFSVMDRRPDFSSIKFLATVGANLADDLKVKMESYLDNITIVNNYAFTEIGTIVASTRFRYKSGSAGNLMANVAIRIYNEDGQLCGPNEIGELHIKSRLPFLGYIKNEKATKEQLDENGWHVTGDVGYMDDDGFLFLNGRSKEMVTYRGKRIYPIMVEEILLRNNNIAKAAVIGIPDDIDEYLLAACVIKVKGSKLTEDEVMKYINDQVPEYQKIRAGVYFYDEFRETASGKIKKRHLIEDIVKLRSDKNI